VEIPIQSTTVNLNSLHDAIINVLELPSNTQIVIGATIGGSPAQVPVLILLSSGGGPTAAQLITDLNNTQNQADISNETGAGVIEAAHSWTTSNMVSCGNSSYCLQSTSSPSSNSKAKKLIALIIILIVAAIVCGCVYYYCWGPGSKNNQEKRDESGGVALEAVTPVGDQPHHDGDEGSGEL